MGPPWFWAVDHAQRHAQNLRESADRGMFDVVQPQQLQEEPMVRRLQSLQGGERGIQMAIASVDGCLDTLQEENIIWSLKDHLKDRKEDYVRFMVADLNLRILRADWFRDRKLQDTWDRPVPKLPTAMDYTRPSGSIGKWLVGLWQKIRGPPWWLEDLAAYDYIITLESQINRKGHYSFIHWMYTLGGFPTRPDEEPCGDYSDDYSEGSGSNWDLS